jgi:hypothetical protein
MGNQSDITFNDRLPVDYTADNVDDGGLINLQTYKRHRCLREAGLPYRKSNSRRVLERVSRRAKRPYFNLQGKLEDKLMEAKGHINVDELDSEFLSRAENNPSLNLVGSDFNTIKGRKYEIQYLIKKHFFPKFDLSNTLEDTVIKKEKINHIIDLLKSENADKFEVLFNFRPIGVGPGEALLYFIYDKAVLGGGSKSGDIFIGGNEYEVKSVKMKGENEVYDFRLGGTVPISNIMKKLTDLSGKEKEISGSDIAAIKAKQPKEFKKIEDEFCKIAYDHYFSKHDVIFFNNGTGEERGNVITVKKVRQSDIRIERVTSGVIKPIIKI